MNNKFPLPLSVRTLPLRILDYPLRTDEPQMNIEANLRNSEPTYEAQAAPAKSTNTKSRPQQNINESPSKRSEIEANTKRSDPTRNQRIRIEAKQIYEHKSPANTNRSRQTRHRARRVIVSPIVSDRSMYLSPSSNPSFLYPTTCHTEL